MEKILWNSQEYWKDNRGNMWLADITEKEAEGLSGTLVNCVGCVECVDCHECVKCEDLRYSSRCVECKHGRKLYGCVDCTECFNCTNCVGCEEGQNLDNAVGE